MKTNAPDHGIKNDEPNRSPAFNGFGDRKITDVDKVLHGNAAGLYNIKL